MEKAEIIQNFSDNLSEECTSPGHAAIKTLAQVIQKSHEQTIQGIKVELEAATSTLLESFKSLLKGQIRTPLSVIAGCDMFRHYAHKTLIDSPYEDFPKIRERLVEQGLRLAEMRSFSMDKIAEVGLRCFRENINILVHGCSQVVSRLLIKASKAFDISVTVTECRPHNEGYSMSQVLSENNIKVNFIVDNAVAAVMEKIDMVIVGSEAIVESGGAINRIGTYGIALIAKAFKKPFYVCAESLKFVRMFPLSQRDLPAYTNSELHLLQECELLRGTQTRICDLTPPSLITLLFTDLGILTPSAISDELIQLYESI